LELRRIQSLPLLKQADALLENPAALQRFPAQELYALICNLGLEDALELVQCTTPAQFCTLVDFAAWRGDGLQITSLLEWLAAALGEDEEAFFSKVQKMDVEVVELLFQRAVQIKQTEGEEEDPSLESMETVDGRWRLEFRVTGASQHVLRRIAEIWMGKNALEFSRFLEAVRWNLPSELEETAFSFRNARLEDLGFPPRGEAASLLSWVDIRQCLLTPEKPSGVDTSLVATSEDFFEEGLKALSVEQRMQLEAEARYLVNAFLVAEGAEAGEVAAIYDLSRQARDYLNLGLHYLSCGQHALLAKAVQQFGLKKIFQVGLSLTLDLKRSLERLRREPHAQWQNLWWTMDALTPLLSALSARRPCLWKEGQKTMFKTLADISFAQAQLEKARRQMKVLAFLHRNEPQKALLPFGVEFGQLRAERFFCAALAHFVFEGKILARPFAASGIAGLEARLCVAGFPKLAKSFAHALPAGQEVQEEAVLEEAQEMAMTCLYALRAEVDAVKAACGSLVAADMVYLPTAV